MEPTNTTRISTIFIVTTLVLTGGCGNSEPTPESANTSAQEVKQEAKEAFQAAEQYSEKQMREYRQILLDKVNALDQSHQKLQQQLESMEEETKNDIKKVIQELYEKKMALEQKTQELKMVTGQTFIDLKTGAEASLAELEKAYEQAIQRFAT